MRAKDLFQWNGLLRIARNVKRTRRVSIQRFGKFTLHLIRLNGTPLGGSRLHTYNRLGQYLEIFREKKFTIFIVISWWDIVTCSSKKNGKMASLVENGNVLGKNGTGGIYYYAIYSMLAAAVAASRQNKTTMENVGDFFWSDELSSHSRCRPRPRSRILLRHRTVLWTSPEQASSAPQLHNSLSLVHIWRAKNSAFCPHMLTVQYNLLHNRVYVYHLEIESILDTLESNIKWTWSTEILQ